jgi:hypothetical protein
MSGIFGQPQIWIPLITMCRWLIPGLLAAISLKNPRAVAATSSLCACDQIPACIYLRARYFVTRKNLENRNIGLR